MSIAMELSAEDVASRPAAAERRPLKVGVLVDLTLAPEAGGHVKCWERIAEAAVGCDDLDLTIHFNGPAPRRIELSPSVRYVLLPPVFSTARVVRRIPDHTDLARWHPRLAQALRGYDVIHTTDGFFCYARTAARFARRHRVPLVSSIHTNTPEYARITTDHLLERLLGRSFAYRVATEALGVPYLVSGALQRQLHKHLRSVTVALRNYGDDPAGAADYPMSGFSLRRGLDRALFTPAKRDRAWTEARFGIACNRTIVMYAGKLNQGKNVPLLGRIMMRLRERGAAAHLLCAGAGDHRAALEAELGDAVTCAGSLSQPELARAYASADVFAFPSAIDEYANAAMEALASGLPVLLARGSGIAGRIADCPAVTILPSDHAEPWAVAVAALAADPVHRLRLARAARAYAETRIPSWHQVLTEDLLPVWRAAAAGLLSLPARQ
ncbi:MAG TPA: glycosyltransferase [Stellaceae bacterium]|nr:glycosyltransferase [Stellaceae bacterium]